MRTLFKIGSISGIKIQLHISWLIIALLIAISLANHFRAVNPAWSTSIVWGSAVITSVLFFASILAHEFSHAVVARLHYLPVRSITLFALGGMAQIEEETAEAKSEFWVSIVGPITSAMIGIICLAIEWLNGWTPMAEPVTPLQAMIVWLGYINIGLAIFNLLPAYPMDGGRVLRAIIWWMTGDKSRATRRASFAGIFISHCLIVLGIFSIFKGGGFGGLWLVLIGWFLIHAARASVAQIDISERLRGMCARDLMARDCPLIDGNTNLKTFVEDHLELSKDSCFLIEQRGELAGLITLQEVATVEHRRWPYTVVYDVMNPIEQLQTVKPETPITEVLELMGPSSANQLAVMSNGQLAGIISRDHIVRLVMTRAGSKLEPDIYGAQ